MTSTSKILLMRQMSDNLRCLATLPEFYARTHKGSSVFYWTGELQTEKLSVGQPSQSIPYFKLVMGTFIRISTSYDMFLIACVFVFLFQGIPLCTHLLPGHIYYRNPRFILISSIMKISPNLSWFGKIS